MSAMKKMSVGGDGRARPPRSWIPLRLLRYAEFSVGLPARWLGWLLSCCLNRVSARIHGARSLDLMFAQTWRPD